MATRRTDVLLLSAVDFATGRTFCERSSVGYLAAALAALKSASHDLYAKTRRPPVGVLVLITSCNTGSRPLWARRWKVKANHSGVAVTPAGRAPANAAASSCSR
ncbi:hypothetical protein EYF80_009834 [Liparis tanakae]|uniref:Uncharacterized protein n=1 Tax=Liparis tanakae TaxID=230148 RepID=A0A4Z2IPR6_9TELE|nr:hypothetical protein EYF80_009834 [Liparis tanakae]